MRIAFILFLIFLLFSLYLLFDKYLFLSEKEKIDKIIEKARSACEREDLNQISQLIAKDYYDNFGHDYYQLLKTLKNVFNLYDEIRIYLLAKKITLKDSIAICSLRVRAIGLAKDTKEYEVFYKELITLYLKNRKIYYAE
jgi:hypothetical protein